MPGTPRPARSKSWRPQRHRPAGERLITTGTCCLQAAYPSFTETLPRANNRRPLVRESETVRGCVPPVTVKVDEVAVPEGVVERDRPGRGAARDHGRDPPVVHEGEAGGGPVESHRRHTGEVGAVERHRRPDGAAGRGEARDAGPRDREVAIGVVRACGVGHADLPSGRAVRDGRRRCRRC